MALFDADGVKLESAMGVYVNTPEKTAHDPERRRYPRLRTKIPVELSCSGKPAIVTTTDRISLCGCYIETMFTLELGTKLGLVFSLNQERVGAKGVVVTKHP